MTTTKLRLTYEEHQALSVIRKLLKRKPEMAAIILEGMSRDAAVRILQQGQKELTDLLALNRALSGAAGAIATHFKEPPCSS
jgi:predicted DNA-binding protein (UPF0251 family)